MQMSTNENKVCNVKKEQCELMKCRYNIFWCVWMEGIT